MNNSFLTQFSSNIKFKYFCFDRVIIRGYILPLFFPAGVVRLLRALGFTRLSNGVMRILTDQLNGHIEKAAQRQAIPIHWWPSEGGGTVEGDVRAERALVIFRLVTDGVLLAEVFGFYNNIIHKCVRKAITCF